MKCFYHNDMDGRCAGSLVAQFTNNYNPENYFEVDYRNPLPIDKVSIGEDVYIVDYSFTCNTVGVLAELINLKCNVVWIDHHKSSIELMKNPDYAWLHNIPGVRNSNASGALLTYLHFNCVSSSEAPMYIRYVDDYDRWIYAFGDNTVYFKLGLETHPYDALDSIWIDLSTKNVTVLKLVASGELIKKYIDMDNAQYLSDFGYESEIAGYKCYVINRRSNSWIFGDKIKQYPIVATWVYDGNRYQYSLYSSFENVDCSKIAEQFGGGGHKGAAGFQSDKLFLTKLS